MQQYGVLVGNRPPEFFDAATDGPLTLPARPASISGLVMGCRFDYIGSSPATRDSGRLPATETGKGVDCRGGAGNSVQFSNDGYKAFRSDNPSKLWQPGQAGSSLGWPA